MRKPYALIVEDDRDELDTILSALLDEARETDVILTFDADEAIAVLYGRGADALGPPALVVIDDHAAGVRELALPWLVRTQPSTETAALLEIVESPDDIARMHGHPIADWCVRKPCSVAALGAALAAARAHRE